MARHNTLGAWGENMAVNYLEKQGYAIRCRDYHFGHRDIDIIAITPDGTTMVFIEVKTRENDAVTKPEDAVTREKVRSIGWTANNYVKRFNVELDLRFDVISIVGTNTDEMKLRHIADAFNPCLV